MTLRTGTMRLACMFSSILLFGAAGLLLFIGLQDPTELTPQQVPGEPSRLAPLPGSPAQGAGLYPSPVPALCLDAWQAEEGSWSPPGGLQPQYGNIMSGVRPAALGLWPLASGPCTSFGNGGQAARLSAAYCLR